MLKLKSYRLLISLLIAASVLLAGVLLVSAAPPAPAAGKLTATPLTIVDTLSPDENAEPWPYIVRLEGEPLANLPGRRCQTPGDQPARDPAGKVERQEPGQSGLS